MVELAPRVTLKAVKGACPSHAPFALLRHYLPPYRLTALPPYRPTASRQAS